MSNHIPFDEPLLDSDINQVDPNTGLQPSTDKRTSKIIGFDTPIPDSDIHNLDVSAYEKYVPQEDVYFNKEKRDEVDIININRTLSLDYMFNEFFMQTIKLPKNIESVPDFYDQMVSLTRTKELNKSGNQVVRYIEQGADHYAHARNYCRVAETIYREIESDLVVAFPNRKHDRHFGGGIKRIMK